MMSEYSKHIRSIYQNPKWGKIQESLEYGHFEVYEYVDKKGFVQYPFIKREAGIVENVTYYDLVTPRGECGPLLTGNVDLVGYMAAFNNFCKDNKIIAEFIKFSPWNDISSMFSDWYSIRQYGCLYEINLEKDFFKNSFNSKLRNIVRKTLKEDIDVQIDNKGDTVNQFIKLYKFTEEKNHISKYYMITDRFIKRYFEELPDNVCIYNAYVGEKLASSAMFVDSENIRHYHFSANHPDYRSLNCNTLILFKAAEDAKRKGLKLMDLGGATPESTLEHYKRQFVKQEEYTPYFVGTRIVDQEKYDYLTEISGGVTINEYFPAYRYKR